jgi:hypothetical protein
MTRPVGPATFLKGKVPSCLPWPPLPLLQPPITGQEWDTLDYLATLGEWSQLAT